VFGVLLPEFGITGLIGLAEYQTLSITQSSQTLFSLRTDFAHQFIPTSLIQLDTIPQFE
jgi:hypothetical protein